MFNTEKNKIQQIVNLNQSNSNNLNKTPSVIKPKTINTSNKKTILSFDVSLPVYDNSYGGSFIAQNLPALVDFDSYIDFNIKSLPPKIKVTINIDDLNINNIVNSYSAESPVSCTINRVDRFDFQRMVYNQYDQYLLSSGYVDYPVARRYFTDPKIWNSDRVLSWESGYQSLINSREFNANYPHTVFPKVACPIFPIYLDDTVTISQVPVIPEYSFERSHFSYYFVKISNTVFRLYYKGQFPISVNDSYHIETVSEDLLNGEVLYRHWYKNDFPVLTIEERLDLDSGMKLAYTTHGDNPPELSPTQAFPLDRAVYSFSEEPETVLGAVSYKIPKYQVTSFNLNGKINVELDND
jgi:hypothetical protein